MVHEVSLDDDVWDELQQRAEPLVDDPNSVLRRVLGLPQPGEGRKSPPETGYLLPYIRSGAITPGTALTWKRPRVGQVLHAEVTETGHLHVAGHPEPFKSPSGAARAAAGVKSVHGWNDAWTLPNGKPLGSIRSQS